MKKYKMDLHIHTPASKCYKGPKTDDEYFKILKSASEQNLDIIAITDHNTISGYERFMQLKEDVFRKIGFLEAYQNESYRMKEEFDDLVKIKNMFESILIFPGVEITLNPGIHILVIGNNNDVELLSDILTDVGYSQEKRGSDNDNAIDVDIISFLKNPKLETLIISAPHVDSKNGIYSEMDGHYRSSVMKNEIITSFSINSETQKTNIIRMLKSDPEYKREKIPAFINCSDAHESSAVGNRYSFVELEEKTFYGLKSLFDNPDGKIFDTYDDGLVHIIEKLEEKEDILLIDKPSENIQDISKVICAALNENIAILIFGVNDNINLIGVSNNNNSFEEKIDKAFDAVSSSASGIKCSIKQYKLGNGKYVFILLIKQDERNLWYIKDEKAVYHLDGNDPVISSIEDIERIVYENTVYDLLDMEIKDEERLSSAKIQLNSIRCRTDKVFTLKQIIKGSSPILHYCDVDVCDASELSDEELDSIPENGTETGNVYYIFKNSIRLNDAILRFSCPTALLSDEIINKVRLYDVKKNSIVIVRGGGTHYINKDGKIFGVNEEFIILSPKENYTCDMKLLLSWMKSSLFTWYVGRKFDTTDIYLPSVLYSAVFPIEKMNESDDVELIVDKILSIEEEFLKNCEKNKASKKKVLDAEEEIESLICAVKEHNRNIAMEMRDLDLYFYDLFGIDEVDEEWISADLAADGIFDLLPEVVVSEE